MTKLIMTILGSVALLTAWADERKVCEGAVDKFEECKNMLQVKDQHSLSVEVGRLTNEVNRLTSENNRLCSENNRLYNESRRLRMENKNLRFLLSKMGESGRGSATNLNAEVKKMLGELRMSDDKGEQRRIVIPTDMELLGDEDGPTVASPEVKGLARPSTYVVQPGDNLAKIAERFYGSRSKWRDIQRANMAIISTDGRVKVGQTIKLP